MSYVNKPDINWGRAEVSTVELNHLIKQTPLHKTHRQILHAFVLL